MVRLLKGSRLVAMSACLAALLPLSFARPAIAGDRFGGTVYLNTVGGRDLAAFKDWMDYARTQQGLPFGELSREVGIGADWIVFKGTRARAGFGGYYSVTFNNTKDARDTTWSTTLDHFGLEMFYAVHLLPAPGPVIPYVGVGTGVDINSFSIKREKAIYALEDGSFMGMSMLGSLNLVFGLDFVGNEKYMLGVRGTYRHLRASPLELKSAGDRAFYGSTLIPTAASYRSAPGDPSRWSPLEWNPSNLNLALVLTWHQPLDRAPGLR